MGVATPGFVFLGASRSKFEQVMVEHVKKKYSSKK